MRSNVTTVNISRDDAKAPGLYQYDYGQRLLFTGADLPDTYEVHFAADYTEESYTRIGNANGVAVPDACLAKAGLIHVWLYLHSGQDSGETRRHILITVRERAPIGAEEPTPAEQSVITETIAALTAAAEQAATAQASAQTSAQTATDAATRAEAAAADTQAILVQGSVPATRKVNGKALSSDIALSAEDVSAMPKTGGSMTGPLYVPSLTTYSAGDGYARLYFRNTPTGSPVAGFTANIARRRLFATEYPDNSSNVERFYFPAPTEGISEDGDYEILTTKDLPSVRATLGTPIASGSFTTGTISAGDVERVTVSGQSLRTSNYIVIFEASSVGSSIGVTNKGTSGFTATVYNGFTNSRPFTVQWAAYAL